MLLSELNITHQKEKQFNNKKIFSIEDLLRFLPKNYYDFRMPVSLEECRNTAKTVAVTGILMNIKRGNGVISAFIKDNISGLILKVSWFHAPYMTAKLRYMYNRSVICCGRIGFNTVYQNFEMNQPIVFSDNIKDNLMIYPVYSNIRGMSDTYLLERINEALFLSQNTEEKYDLETLEHFNIVPQNEMYRMIHRPKIPEEITIAKKRLIFEVLYDFAEEMELRNREEKILSPYIIRSLNKTNEFIQSLPYTLTYDQQEILNELIETSKIGKHINALIQGDVSCGKTIVAFITMFAMADNGYQSVLMAPTSVLAEQHYKELNVYGEKLGFKTAYLSGDMKASEKKKMITGIKEGKYNFIVGTHAVVSKEVAFYNLGLTIADEEHRFGVNQRMKLTKGDGVHNISMSATPIPRSFALSLYGKATTIHTIKTMPNGRLPVKTCIYNDYKKIYNFMYSQIKEGRQCYIVCPAKSENMDSEVQSVEEEYNRVFAAFSHTGIRIAMLTGSTPTEEQKQILSDFQNSDIQILIATTIIEVGVNVPNASVIVIQNAERFGLATLHQLRGRVGRGKYQSYCVLLSEQLDNLRLLALCKSNDGFEITRIDLELRGPGDFIGTKQSGESREIMLMFQYPNLYKKIEKYVEEKKNREISLKF